MRVSTERLTMRTGVPDGEQGQSIQAGGDGHLDYLINITNNKKLYSFHLFYKVDSLKS